MQCATPVIDSEPLVSLAGTAYPRRNQRTASRSSRHVAGRPRYVQTGFAQTRERRGSDQALRGTTFEVPYPLDIWSSSGHAYDSAILGCDPFCES